MNPLLRRACALALCALAPTAARADQPLWELGAGAGTLHVPHYRGADQRHHWLLPIPYVVFRGEIFRSDREGTRAVLLDTERFDFDLSVDASPPLKSSDSRARAGMADLAPTLEIGPKLNLLLGKGPGWKLNLRVPVRAVTRAAREVALAPGAGFQVAFDDAAQEVARPGWGGCVDVGGHALAGYGSRAFYRRHLARAAP